MVIEHTFVTTYAAADAMGAATAFLSGLGFEHSAPVAFEVGRPEWNCAEMRRDPNRSVGKLAAIDVPQTIRIEFDRGRVVVAASVESTRRSFWTGTPREMPAASPKLRPRVELLMTLLVALERILAQQQSLEEVHAPLRDLEGDCAATSSAPAGTRPS